MTLRGSIRQFFLIALASILFPLVSQAQITNVNGFNATPTQGAGHDYIRLLTETTNPADGSVSLRIGLSTPPGRQLTLPFSIAYDTNGTFFPVDGGGGPAIWVSNPSGYLYAGGWAYLLPSLSFINIQKLDSTRDGGSTCGINTGYIFRDSAGGRHPLGIANNLSSQVATCSIYSNFPNNGDDSVSAHLRSGGAVQLSDLSNNAFSFANPITCVSSDGSIQAPASNIEDRNGNTIAITATSCSGAFSLTDTLGRTAISSSGFGTTGNTISISGTTNPYTMTWGTASSTYFPNAYKFPIIQGTVCESFLSNVHSIPVVTAITLPNGQQYRFQYDPTYGLLSKITYPGGGYVSYVWGSNLQSDAETITSSICDWRFDKPAVMHRSVSFDGINVAQQQDFAYSTNWETSPPTSWASKQTTVTTHDLVLGTTSQTVYTYSPTGGNTLQPYLSESISQIPLEQSIVYKDNNGNTLRTISKTWFTVGEISSEQTTLDNGKTSKVTYTWQAPGYLAEKDEFDFGQTSPSRKTINTYQAFANMPNNPGTSFVGLPCQSVIFDGSGNRVAETDYFYDGTTSTTPCTTPTTQTLTGTGSYPGHDETIYGTSASVPRGNITRVIKLCLQATPTCSAGNSTTNYAYDETGQVTSATDANGRTTQYSYADNYSVGTAPGNTNAFVTQITKQAFNGIAHISKFAYGYADGQLLSSTDENNQVTSYQYNDPFARPTQVNYPDGGKTTISYNDAAPTPSVSTTRLVTASPTLSISTTSIADGIGHVTQTQLTTDPDGTTYTDVTYDGFGRIRTQSNPHRSASAATDGITTTFYDALGRTCLVVPPDGTLPTGGGCPTSQPSNTIFTTYSGNTTTVTDQAGKSRKSVTDGLGRLTQVFEDPAGLNYETDYSYDVLGNLLTVNQKGNDTNSANWRTRTFTYNSLSQLLTAANPESGTISYAYDLNGNLSTKTSPKPNQSGTATVVATYTYDALNRLTQKSFNDGSTPTVSYVYDGNATPTGCTLPTLTLTNPIGRRTGMCDAAGSEAWSFDSLGRVTSDNRITSGVTKLTTYSYNLDGSLNTFSIPTYADGSHPFYITYQQGGAGRSLGTTGSLGIGLVHYTPSGALCYMQGSWDYNWITTSTFNNRLQPARTQTGDFFPGSTPPPVCAIGPIQSSGIASTFQDLSYSFVDASGHNNGNVVTIANNVDIDRSQSFSYDSLNRISSAWTTGTNQPVWSGDTDYLQECWAENYSYDPWGNLLKLSPSSSSSYTGCTQESGFDFTNAMGANNRIAASGYVYDAAGNMTTSPGAGTVVFNAENQMISAGSVNYLYDGDGKRVSKSSGTLYWYGTGSDALLETNTSGNAVSYYVFFNGQRVARFNGGGVQWYMTDHLGSSRVIWSTAGADISDFYPFGGERVISAAAGGNNRYKFTGKERDSESGLDNFGARFDSSTLGRFMSPDPENAGASDDDPQSWNAYSYALNNPLNATDPDGREPVFFVCDTYGRCSKLTQDEFDAFQKNSKDLLFNSGKGLIYAKNSDGSAGELIGGYSSYDNKAEGAVAFLNFSTGIFASNYLRLLGPLAKLGLAGRGITTLGIDSAAAFSANAAEAARAAQAALTTLQEGATLERAGRGVHAAEIFSKTGGFDQALQDFERLPGNESVKGPVRVKELADGTKVNVRNFSSDGRPSLEIQRTDGTATKYRYN